MSANTTDQLESTPRQQKGNGGREESGLVKSLSEVNISTQKNNSDYERGQDRRSQSSDRSDNVDMTEKEIKQELID
jgi:hypothetical protein